MDVIKLQIYHAYTHWEHYTFAASKPQDFCLFIDSVISHLIHRASPAKDDQWRDIGKRLSTAQQPLEIKQFKDCGFRLVYKCQDQRLWQATLMDTVVDNLTFSADQSAADRAAVHRPKITRGQETTWLLIQPTSELYTLTMLWSRAAARQNMRSKQTGRSSHDCCTKSFTS